MWTMGVRRLRFEMNWAGTQRANCLESGVRVASSGARLLKPRRGQAMVEFALISTVALFVLLVGIQLAIIGQKALSVSQLAYQGARYAAVNATTAGSDIVTYLEGIAPPALSVTGLSITVNPSTVPRAFSSTVSVTVSYDLRSSLVLPNPFLGISFPTSLSATETAMSE
jgi:Flp pilus assembly protein TadG